MLLEYNKMAPLLDDPVEHPRAAFRNKPAVATPCERTRRPPESDRSGDEPSGLERNVTFLAVLAEVQPLNLRFFGYSQAHRGIQNLEQDKGDDDGKNPTTI